MTLLNQLSEALSTDERLVIDGKLAKNKIVELALNLDPTLLKLLLTNEQLKNHFFEDIEGMLIFDKVAFQRFVNNKSFLPDSFTQFKNKIGLSADNHYLTDTNDVVLSWPYKDCVLEGGQTKDDQKRGEIFWNETLAPEQVDHLLQPKVLTDFRKISKNNSEVVDDISDEDSLLIKGNNLFALHSLHKKYAGKIKAIFIDPPYNTGSDSFKYNDSFNESSWLTFMKNRLDAAKKLLSNDGSIFVQLDYNQSHYCKVLMDQVFGRECFKNEIIWQRTTNTGSSKGMANKLSSDTDSILYYSKTANVSFNKIYNDYKPEYIKRFNKEDSKGKYRWQYMATYSNKKYADLEDKGEVRWLEGSAKPEYKQYLDGLKGIPLNNLWTDIFHVNPMAKEGVEFKTQKPEDLIERILSISTNEGDIVLDFFSGSGTTAATALKMKRKFIAIEQMDYIDTVTLPRLEKVVGNNDDYDSWGISKKHNWTGGGSFIYCKLAESASKYSDCIEVAKSSADLITIWNELKESSNLSYKVDPKLFDKNIASFSELSFEDQQRFLIEAIDKNQLYVNYSDIDDETNKISVPDKKLNRQFYGA